MTEISKKLYYSIATIYHIKGRSSMSKSQLQTSIREHYLCNKYHLIWYGKINKHNPLPSNFLVAENNRLKAELERSEADIKRYIDELHDEKENNQESLNTKDRMLKAQEDMIRGLVEKMTTMDKDIDTLSKKNEIASKVIDKLKDDVDEKETIVIQQTYDKEQAEEKVILLRNILDDCNDNPDKFKELENIIDHKNKKYNELVLIMKEMEIKIRKSNEEKEIIVRKIKNCYSICNDWFGTFRDDDEKWDWVNSKFPEAQVEMCKKIDREYADYKCPTPPAYEEFFG